MIISPEHAQVLLKAMEPSLAGAPRIPFLEGPFPVPHAFGAVDYFSEVDVFCATTVPALVESARVDQAARLQSGWQAWREMGYSGFAAVDHSSNGDRIRAEWRNYGAQRSVSLTQTRVMTNTDCFLDGDGSLADRYDRLMERLLEPESELFTTLAIGQFAYGPRATAEVEPSAPGLEWQQTLVFQGGIVEAASHDLQLTGEFLHGALALISRLPVERFGPLARGLREALSLPGAQRTAPRLPLTVPAIFARLRQRASWELVTGVTGGAEKWHYQVSLRHEPDMPDVPDHLFVNFSQIIDENSQTVTALPEELRRFHAELMALAVTSDV